MHTLIVDLTCTTSRTRVLDAAIRLAEDMEAHLVGLYVMRSRLIHTGLYGGGGAFFDRDLDRAERRIAAEREEEFSARLEYKGLTHEFRLVDTEGLAPADLLAKGARMGDLFITGHDRGSPFHDASEAHAAGQAVLGSGRPVLLVPEGGDTPLGTGTALVGWDGSREAARAVFDALPLLKIVGRAELVTVTLSSQVGPRSERLRASGQDAAEALGRHGVEATHRLVPAKGKSEREVLLALAEDAALTVIGAYHHSRTWEAVLGGVTRDFLLEPPSPVLLSA